MLRPEQAVAHEQLLAEREQMLRAEMAALKAQHDAAQVRYGDSIPSQLA